MISNKYLETIMGSHASRQSLDQPYRAKNNSVST